MRSTDFVSEYRAAGKVSVAGTIKLGNQFKDTYQVVNTPISHLYEVRIDDSPRESYPSYYFYNQDTGACVGSFSINAMPDAADDASPIVRPGVQIVQPHMTLAPEAQGKGLGSLIYDTFLAGGNWLFATFDHSSGAGALWDRMATKGSNISVLYNFNSDTVVEPGTKQAQTAVRILGPKERFKNKQVVAGLEEARTNPEQNVKAESGMKALQSVAETISDPENWAVSMTGEPKLGINPQVGISEDTPKGIYFYPLDYAVDSARRGKKLPWGDNMPYIQLFQYDRSGEMTKKTKVDPARLKQALLQYCPEEVIQQAAEENEYDGTPYWFIYDCLSRLGKGDETNVVRWNKVLRDLGFTSVYDDGAGWIAHNEPTQGVVLDPRIIKQHKTISNKKQSGVVTPAVIERDIFNTLDIELASDRAWQAYDPDGSKLKAAAKELAKRPEFKQWFGKPGSEEIFDKAASLGRYGAVQLRREAWDWYKEQQTQQPVTEAFDQPYRLKWEKSDYTDDVDALAKMDDGGYLSIMFNKGYNQATKEEAWSVEFFRNSSQEVTGEGDQQRVFATVLGAIQKFIKKYKPNNVIFAASKQVEAGQNSASRARLYDRLVQRYATSWGFRMTRADTGNKVIYDLSRIKPIVAKAVAESKQPGQPVVDAILKAMPIAQEIWFHGSRAIGKHRKNSDTDILVVVPDDLVGDRYLGVVRILQKLSSHFDNYDIQPTRPGYNIHLIAQEEGRLLWSNKQAVAEGTLNEYRNALYDFVKSKFPNWPEYVLKDFLYAQAKGIRDQEELNDFLERNQKDLGQVKWRLEKLPITLDIFTPKTQQMITQRAGGSSNPMQVPNDAERHAQQLNMIQQQGVRTEPIIVAKLNNGYDLIEGWHRTIQHLQQYPEGYTGPAWVAYGATYTSESKQGVAEELEEGWKDALGNLAIAGAIGTAGAGGLAASDAYHKWQAGSATPAATAQAPQAKQAQAPVAKSAIARGVQQAQDAKKVEPQPKSQPKVQQVTNITNNPLESVLRNVASHAGLAGIELAAFMAQCAHETLDFKRLTEFGGSLDFRKYDPKYAPKKAKALGNKYVGDGAKYKGRGFIQLTGRHNYKKAGQELGLPLEKHPEMVEDPKIAAQVAVWFWKHRVQPNVDNYGDVKAVTKMINPGMRGLTDRSDNFKSYLGITS